VRATSLLSRTVYAAIALAVGALIGLLGMSALLTLIGPLFHDAHPGMEGFGYFMMMLAGSAATGITGALIFITLPWKRPVKASGKARRGVVAAMLSLLTFVFLTEQGHAPAFVSAVTVWIALATYFTYVRHGIVD
jgi:hypothetical protein